MNQVIFSKPYPKEVNLNPFGDYFRLVLIGLRDEQTEQRLWMLVPRTGCEIKVLNESERLQALEAMFFS